MKNAFLLCIFPVLILLISCSQQKNKEDVYRIAVIPKGTTHVFWKSIHAGAIKAEGEFNEKGIPVEIIWKGPLKEDDRTAQIGVVENFIGQQISGIVLAPLDSKALVAPVKRALRSGIPVAVIDSDLAFDEIVCFAATDNFSGGFKGGEFLGKLLNGKGKVILLRYQVGSASTEKREAGFLKAISKFDQMEVLSENQYAGPTRDSAQTAAQNLLNRFQDEIDGIFTPNESSTNGMLLALRASKRAGGLVKFVGFDGGDQNIEGLRKGDIQGLVLQDPFRMGYLGVKAMIDHLTGANAVEKRIDTGVWLINAQNLENPEIHDLLYPLLDKYLK